MMKKAITAAALVTCAVYTDTSIAAIVAGDVFGIDVGDGVATNAVGNDWVEISGENGSSAGVHTLDNVVLAGVTVTFSRTPAGNTFSNNDGSNANYSALSSAPELDNFVESVVTDIAGAFGGPGPTTYTATIVGLDDSLTYDVVSVAANNASTNQTETLTIGALSSSVNRGGSTAASVTFNSITGAVSSGGVLVIDFTSTAGGGSNPILSGFQVTAVPEPGSLALLGLGGLCVLCRRRCA